MDTVLLLLGLTLIPLVINKTTERGRFDFLHPWLREIWVILCILFTYYVLAKPNAREIAMSFHRRGGFWSYVIVFVAGGLLLCFYWWITGRLLKGTPLPPTVEDKMAQTSPTQSTGRRTTFYSPPPSFTLDHPNDSVRVIFKSSPLLTQKVKTRITQDVTRFRKYLVNLGIAAPLDPPPFNVDLSDNTGGLHTPPQLPAYRGTILIGRKVIHDPTQATSAYCNYVLQMQFERVLNTFEDIIRTTVIQRSMMNYFNWSFWDKRSEEPDIYASLLWQIRDKFGKDFTDQLVTYTLKSMLDDPLEGAAGMDFDLYFRRKLKIGDSVIDNGDKWPEIDDILNKNGRPIDKI